MLNTYQQRERNKMTAIIITLVIVVGLVVFIDRLNQKDAALVASTTSTSNTAVVGTTPTTPASNDTTANSDTVSNTAASTASYKNGTYTADATYSVPHGYEDIKVTLTVQDGTVTSSDIVNSQGDHDSIRYQNDFTAVYKTFVVGKSLDQLNLSRVSGASDTTDGFNDALTKIRQQAQA